MNEGVAKMQLEIGDEDKMKMQTEGERRIEIDCKKKEILDRLEDRRERKKGEAATAAIVFVVCQANDHGFRGIRVPKQKMNTGKFSVSSVRNIIDDVYLPKSEVSTRWVKEVPIKINILAWKISLDRLATHANFLARGLEIPSILYPLCNEAVESSSHIFFSCSLSRQVMFKVCRWWDLNNSAISSYVEWLVWLSTSRLSKHRNVIFEGVCYVAWWILWRFRIQILFGPKHPRRNLIFDDIVQISFLWISNRCKSKIDWNTWMQNPNLLSL
ncbi:RNA-directed DNA polymerase, eukaryota [Tanacetum coccineum]|uniref:RNA-directed DNA polymerase, eukaryota n=1 Tax=Tanacetum coccineum TaxID=301880 RepID=A0ABQ5IHY5_9ASTR